MSETDTHDAFKKAERRGYAKGYEAGKIVVVTLAEWSAES